MRKVVSFKDFEPSLLENKKVDPENVLLLEAYSNTIELLKNAIQNKFVCTIYYRGEQRGLIDDGYRYIEPYALGVNDKGNTVLRAWLIKGKSRRGRIDPKQVPGWRLFRIDRIASVSTSLQTFTSPKTGYNADDAKMTQVTYSAKF